VSGAALALRAAGLPLRLAARARRYKAAALGAAIVAGAVLAAVAAPLLAPYDPLDQSIVDRLAAPSPDYWLGTDGFGRDVLSRILWGGRVSLFVSACSVLIAVAVGGALGLIAGYVGGRVDRAIMAAMDVLLSFPSLVMGLMVVAMLGPTAANLILAIALTAIAPFARIARAPTLVVREHQFVDAGRALGFTNRRIMLRHVLPNIVDDVLVMAFLWLATAIRTEASLAFLGLGVRPPTPTWGGMIREGFETILDAPWLAVFPSLGILVVMLGLNLLGDGLRDATDPRLRVE
jgi:peptide/nickel transport system permease protein